MMAQSIVTFPLHVTVTVYAPCHVTYHLWQKDPHF